MKAVFVLSAWDVAGLVGLAVASLTFAALWGFVKADERARAREVGRRKNAP